MTCLLTARLELAPFRDEHIPALHLLNSDPEVMRFITGRPETYEETARVVSRVKARWAQFGYSWWSLIDRESGEVIGAAALQHLRRKLDALPDPQCPLEIGWRLRPDHWHMGLATEAAQTIASFAFDTIGCDEIYAVCQPENLASIRVMTRLGMRFAGIQYWYERELTTYCLAASEWYSAKLAVRSSASA